jgi:hypothetical protein
MFLRWVERIKLVVVVRVPSLKFSDKLSQITGKKTKHGHSMSHLIASENHH